MTFCTGLSSFILVLLHSACCLFNITDGHMTWG